MNGDVKIIEKQRQDNYSGPRRNNFMNEDIYNNENSQTNRKDSKDEPKKKNANVNEDINKK